MHLRALKILWNFWQNPARVQKTHKKTQWGQNTGMTGTLPLCLSSKFLVQIRFLLSVVCKFLDYHAVGNYYLKYSWEYFMQKFMHNIFLYCGQPEYFR